MSIHHEHPFQSPEDQRSPARRLRGRLPSPVTLWTCGQGAERAGLTVSSVLIADGDPAWVTGVIDPLSDLAELLPRAGAAVVSVLGWPQRALADVFGFVAPAPGGPFRAAEFADTEWGPVPVGVPAWAGCRVTDAPPTDLGWGQLVSLRIEHVHLGEDTPPLVHRRGRYATF